MPDYRTARRGVSQSEAQLEAAVVAPNYRVMLNTFEIYNTYGTSEGPIYLVNSNDALTAKKEVGAARDDGTYVNYMAAKIEISVPTESDEEGAPEIGLTVGHVQGELAAALDRSRGHLDVWEVIERVYSSDDITGPAILPPLRLVATFADMDESTASLKAGFGDPASVSVPSVTFNRREHPGLVR